MAQPGRLRRLGLRAERRPGRPAKSTRCAGNDALNLPMVTGPIALAYNLSGVDSLTLTPEVLAGIFAGTITNWNDPEIAARQPGVTLPDLAIQAVHRAEDSGTTENFTKYLKAAAAGAWTFEPGEVVGRAGRRRRAGQRRGVQAGHQHRRFHRLRRVGLRASTTGCTWRKIDNGGGAVELTAESAGKAVAAARWPAPEGPGAEARLRHQGRRASTRWCW